MTITQLTAPALSYIHVTDLTEPLASLDHILNNNKIKTSYNVGVGKGTSVNKLLIYLKIPII